MDVCPSHVQSLNQGSAPGRDRDPGRFSIPGFEDPGIFFWEKIQKNKWAFIKKTGSRFQKSIPVLGSRGDPGPNADPRSRLVMALTSREVSVLNSFEFRHRCFIEFDVEIESSCVFNRHFRVKLFFDSIYEFFLLWCLHPVLLFLMMASRKELWAPPCRPSLFFPIFLTVTYLYNFKEKSFLVIILYFQYLILKFHIQNFEKGDVSGSKCSKRPRASYSHAPLNYWAQGTRWANAN